MQRNHVLGVTAAVFAAALIALVVLLAIDDEPAGEPPEEVTAARTSTTTAESTGTSTAPGETSPTTTAAGAGSTATGEALRFDGYGRYRVGMTTRESGLRVDPDSSPDPQSCGFAEIGNGVMAMIAADRIVRFDVLEGSKVKSEAGVGVGSTEDEVKRAYGARVEVRGHEYQELGHYLVVRDPSRQNLQMLFETDGNRVLTFRSGERNAVEAPEGCA